MEEVIVTIAFAFGHGHMLHCDRVEILSTNLSKLPSTVTGIAAAFGHGHAWPAGIFGRKNPRQKASRSLGSWRVRDLNPRQTWVRFHLCGKYISDILFESIDPIGFMRVSILSILSIIRRRLALSLSTHRERKPRLAQQPQRKLASIVSIQQRD